MTLDDKTFYLFCTTLGSVALAFFAVIFARNKSYLDEKGKMLATKEDIGSITKEVEAIKNQLVFSMQSRLSLKVEERQALLNYYEKYALWFELTSNVTSEIVWIQSVEKLDELGYKIKQAQSEYLIALAKLRIFVRTPEISEITIKATSVIHAFSYEAYENVYKAKSWHGKIMMLREQIQNNEATLDMDKEEFDNLCGRLLATHKAFLDEQASSSEAHSKEMLKVLAVDTLLTQAIYDQLKSIIDS